MHENWILWTYGVLPLRARKRRNTRDEAPRGKGKKKKNGEPPPTVGDSSFYRRAVTASITSGTAFGDDAASRTHARTHAQRNKLSHTRTYAHTR